MERRNPRSVTVNAFAAGWREREFVQEDQFAAAQALRTRWDVERRKRGERFGRIVSRGDNSGRFFSVKTNFIINELEKDRWSSISDYFNLIFLFFSSLSLSLSFFSCCTNEYKGIYANARGTCCAARSGRREGIQGMSIDWWDRTRCLESCRRRKVAWSRSGEQSPRGWRLVPLISGIFCTW